MKNNEVIETTLCTNCKACHSVCPKNAIYFEEDEYGQEHAFIDEKKCIHCNLCQKVCPRLNQIKNKVNEVCYAATRTNNDKRKDSSSGGIAALLYEKFLSDNTNSKIYGVCYDNCFKYIGTDNPEDIEKFKGSKYVQANSTDLYRDIEFDLKNNKKVLVVGLPCQIQALYNFLKIKNIDTHLLITIDLICHGVSPQKYLDDYLNYLMHNSKSNLVRNISFRSNRMYKNFHMSVLFSHGSYDQISQNDPYFRNFLDGTILRDNCYKCIFSTPDRVSDITLGDFIGLGKHKEFPEYTDSNINVSIVICNTKKGEELFDTIKNDINYQQRDIKEAYYDCVSLVKPFAKSKDRELFLSLYKKSGFINALLEVSRNKIRKMSLKERIIHKIKLILRDNIIERK